jgi:hypothetical protein
MHVRPSRRQVRAYSHCHLNQDNLVLTFTAIHMAISITEPLDTDAGLNSASTDDDLSDKDDFWDPAYVVFLLI